MVLHKNRIIGVAGHGKNRAFFIDGKCDECGATLSKSWNCFMMADTSDLEQVLKSKYICDECAKKEFERDWCTNCDNKSDCTEEDWNACYAGFCQEGSEVRCGCPL